MRNSVPEASLAQKEPWQAGWVAGIAASATEGEATAVRERGKNGTAPCPDTPSHSLARPPVEKSGLGKKKRPGDLRDGLPTVVPGSLQRGGFSGSLPPLAGRSVTGLLPRLQRKLGFSPFGRGYHPSTTYLPPFRKSVNDFFRSRAEKVKETPVIPVARPCGTLRSRDPLGRAG